MIAIHRVFKTHTSVIFNMAVVVYKNILKLIWWSYKIVELFIQSFIHWNIYFHTAGVLISHSLLFYPIFCTLLDAQINHNMMLYMRTLLNIILSHMWIRICIASHEYCWNASLSFSMNWYLSVVNYTCFCLSIITTDKFIFVWVVYIYIYTSCGSTVLDVFLLFFRFRRDDVSSGECLEMWCVSCVDSK